MRVCTARTRAARGFGSRRVAVRRVDDEARRAAQAPPRVLAEPAVLVDAGHRAGLERLHEQRAHPADEHHGIGVQSPRHAVGAEEPRVTARGGYSCSSIATDSASRRRPAVACATSMPVDDVAEQVVSFGSSLRVQSSMQMKNCEPFVFGPGVRHRDRAERVLALHRLVGELVAGTAAAGALGAAALDHELGHDAVEREPVVVALPREADEVVDGVRRERGSRSITIVPRSVVIVVR